MRAEGGTYSLAGALAAVYGVANAVGQPVLGGWWICAGSRGCSCAGRRAVGAGDGRWFAFAGTGSLAVAYGAVAAAGLIPRPWGRGCAPCGRPWLPEVGHVHGAYGHDAVAQEVMFTVGRLLVTVCNSFCGRRRRDARAERHRVLGALSVVSRRGLGVTGGSVAARRRYWLAAALRGGCFARWAPLTVGMALGSITVAAASTRSGRRGHVYGWLMGGFGLGADRRGGFYGAPAVERWPAASACVVAFWRCVISDDDDAGCCGHDVCSPCSPVSSSPGPRCDS
ncbi:hypothetical protein GCM10023238_10340 [Streptomyces heliomycini]